MLLQAYKKDWINDFQSIKNVIEEGLNDINVSIEHIGSTAIPHLSAKPIVDIDIVYYADMGFNVIKSRLQELGYEHKGNQGIKDRDVFKRIAPSINHEILDFISHHLYVCPNYSEELHRHILFRDYLKNHNSAREQYEKLKLEIAREANQDRKAYALLKEKKAKNFIESILQLAKT